MVSLIFSICVYCFYFCCEKEKIYGAPLFDENDITMSIGTLKDNELVDVNDQKIEVKEEYIGINADKVTLLPYTMTIYVIMTIIFYFGSTEYIFCNEVKLFFDGIILF